MFLGFNLTSFSIFTAKIYKMYGKTIKFVDCVLTQSVNAMLLV